MRRRGWGQLCQASSMPPPLAPSPAPWNKPASGNPSARAAWVTTAMQDLKSPALPVGAARHLAHPGCAGTGVTADCNGDKFSRALIRSGGCRTNRPGGIEGGRTAVFGTPIFGERRGKWIVGTSVKKVPAEVPANTVLKGLEWVNQSSVGVKLDSKRKCITVKQSAMT
jgi:hypothetical protein